VYPLEEIEKGGRREKKKLVMVCVQQCLGQNLSVEWKQGIDDPVQTCVSGLSFQKLRE